MSTPSAEIRETQEAQQRLAEEEAVRKAFLADLGEFLKGYEGKISAFALTQGGCTMLYNAIMAGEPEDRATSVVAVARHFSKVIVTAILGE